MDYSYILKSSLPLKDKLKDLGFVEEGRDLVLKRDIMGGEFYALFCLGEKTFSAEVYETESDERYFLFDVPSVQGAFVGEIRKEVNALVEEIRIEGFFSEDVRKKYGDYLYSRFGAKGDRPWEKDGDSTSTVYRLPNGKWFALVLRIKFRNLGFESYEPVWAVNLKAENAASLADGKSVFPAYHMNKKHWITVLLTPVTDFEKLCDLTEKSFNLVQKKNPK